ncbi:MAG: permease [Patescibacteria group bacterium]
MNSKKFTKAFKMTLFSFQASFPMLLGVIILMGIAEAIIPPEAYSNFFTGNSYLDPVIGATVGSFMAGSPITSYIIGGEFLKQGVSTDAVVAFLMAWTTVGFLQTPLEATFLGIRFTIFNTVVAFISAIAVGSLVTFLIGIVS